MPFLRCQLGRNITESRRVGDSTLSVSLFHLVAFGETWEEAVRHLEFRRVAVERPSFAPDRPAEEEPRNDLGGLLKMGF